MASVFKVQAITLMRDLVAWFTTQGRVAPDRIRFISLNVGHASHPRIHLHGANEGGEVCDVVAADKHSHVGNFMSATGGGVVC